MQFKTILNRVQRHPSFVYERVRLVEGEVPRLEVEVRARANSRACCSGCGRTAAGYDTLPARRFEFVPLWGMAVFLVYAMRRVDCPSCGVRVERVPWATGKHTLTDTWERALRMSPALMQRVNSASLRALALQPRPRLRAGRQRIREGVNPACHHRLPALIKSFAGVAKYTAESARTIRGAHVHGAAIHHRTRDDFDFDKHGNRLLKQIDVHEVSLVTFLMNPEAVIQTVKSQLPDPRSMERHLRERGCSQKAAKEVIHLLSSDVMPDEEEPCDADPEVIEAAQKLQSLFIVGQLRPNRRH